MNKLYDSFNDALVACVVACGGSAQVGPKLWPEKTREAAQRALLDCLNDDRPARLTPDQVLLVLALAKAKGCHIGMHYMAGHLGYSEPVPVEPKDELAELLRVSNELRRQLLAHSERIEKLVPQTSLRSVA